MNHHSIFKLPITEIFQHHWKCVPQEQMGQGWLGIEMVRFSSVRALMLTCTKVSKMCLSPPMHQSSLNHSISSNFFIGIYSELPCIWMNYPNHANFRQNDSSSQLFTWKLNAREKHAWDAHRGTYKHSKHSRSHKRTLTDNSTRPHATPRNSASHHILTYWEESGMKQNTSREVVISPGIWLNSNNNTDIAWFLSSPAASPFIIVPQSYTSSGLLTVRSSQFPCSQCPSV